MECKEESVLETYFSLLANFSHDRAREVVAAEPGLPAAALGQLAMAERQYLALAFLQPRTSVFQVRKDPSLVSVYRGLVGDLEALGTAWAQEAAVLVRLRAGMIGVYERLASCPPSQAPPYTEVTAALSSLVEAAGGVQEQPALHPWLTTVRCETQALLDFLSAALAMQAWHFLPALMLLARGAGLLGRWEGVVGARERVRLSFASSLLRGVTGWVDPHLYLWLARLKASLLSKFSLYFHTTLARQAPPPELARLCTKLAVDQPARLAAFQKRVDAQAVLVVYSGLEQGDCGRPGYQHGEGASPHPPTGLHCLPVVFATPGPLPDHLLPGLVMILTDRSADLAADRPIYFYDPGLQVTYFLACIEPRLFLVTVCDGRRAERDGGVNSFIQETVGQLRCTKLCNALKPGHK